MSLVSCDYHEFSLKTKALEQEACDWAVMAAKNLVQTSVSFKAHATSKKICRKAFAMFQKNMQGSFSSDVCVELVSLTLKSRENLFFIDLKERLIPIFQNAHKN
ncbi:MAG: hypothetical protein ACOVOR_01170 [Rhabdochlamydiaceae bacterium]